MRHTILTILFHELVAPTFGDMVDQVDLAQYRSGPTCPLSLDFAKQNKMKQKYREKKKKNHRGGLVLIFPPCFYGFFFFLNRNNRNMFS